MANLDESVAWVNRQKEDGKKVGFVCSCFDLLHAGHYLMLKDSKAQCDVLLVGLQTDPTVNEDYRVATDGKNKNKPIQDYTERFIQIEGCRYVDYIVKYETEEELYELIKAVNPDVRILGSDCEGKKYTGWDLPPTIHFHRRDHDYSTSNLRKRVYSAEAEKMMQ